MPKYFLLAFIPKFVYTQMHIATTFQIALKLLLSVRCWSSNSTSKHQKAKTYSRMMARCISTTKTTTTLLTVAMFPNAKLSVVSQRLIFLRLREILCLSCCDVFVYVCSERAGRRSAQTNFNDLQQVSLARRQEGELRRNQAEQRVRGLQEARRTTRALAH